MSTYTVTTKTYKHYNKPSNTPDKEVTFEIIADATAYLDTQLPALKVMTDCFWTIELTKDSDTESKTLYIASNEGAKP